MPVVRRDWGGDRARRNSVFDRLSLVGMKALLARQKIQKFVGALHGHNASKGVFITTSKFSDEADRYAKGINLKIVLVDGQKLAQLMIDHGVGVSTSEIYEIKKIDSDYFIEE
ncbi:MAG: hypothetical protein HC895_20840 [Leptolyngbyaceae cyanobacterium SM1_3_5]|nr:hypothetical protein [Leptolyngbyaceae cyanobacterium SM1_3_5]